MTEEKSFFDELPKQEDPFADLGKEEETPPESSPENNQEKDKPEEGEVQDKAPNTPVKEVPFHENPRWQQRERELEELRAFKEEAEAKFQSLEKNITPSEVSIPRWFSTLYGENTEAWEAYQEHEGESREQLKREVIESQKQEQYAAQQEEQKWLNWVEDGVQSLKSEGKVFDKNELLKAVLDYGFTDESGNYDFRKAYNYLEATKGTRPSPQTEAKKKIADISSSGKGGESTQKDYLSQKDLRHKSWSSL
jgi:hypothetical protein